MEYITISMCWCHSLYWWTHFNAVKNLSSGADSVLKKRWRNSLLHRGSTVFPPSSSSSGEWWICNFYSFHLSPLTLPSLLLSRKGMQNLHQFLVPLIEFQTKISPIFNAENQQKVDFFYLVAEAEGKKSQHIAIMTIFILPNQQCFLHKLSTALRCRNIVNKHWLSMYVQIGAKCAKTCTDMQCSNWVSILHTPIGGWVWV